MLMVSCSVFFVYSFLCPLHCYSDPATDRDQWSRHDDTIVEQAFQATSPTIKSFGKIVIS